MIYIAVCDDDIRLCSQLKDYIKKWKKERKLEVEIFNTGREFEKVLREWHLDLISLDIVMKNCSDIELSWFIREELGNDTSMIIYISGYGDEYTLELPQFRSSHSLKRPFKPEEFQQVFFGACDRIQGGSGILGFKSSRTACRIFLRDTHYFEGDNRRTKIVTVTRTYHCYSIIENLSSRINMEQAGFVRPHKSYAINLCFVARFSVRMVTLFGGEEFTVSAPLKENARRQYGAYSGRIGRQRRSVQVSKL